MQALSGCKGGALIDFALEPHREDHTHPDVCQGTNRHTVAFSLLAFAIVISLRPLFLVRALPGKLMQGIAHNKVEMSRP